MLKYVFMLAGAAAAVAPWSSPAIAQGYSQTSLYEASKTGPVETDLYKATFIRLGSTSINGLFYEPKKPGPNAHVAVVYTYPRSQPFYTPVVEMAGRGYRVMMVKHYMGSRRGEVQSPLDGFTETSRAIRYLRALPGVDKVVVIGWGMGALTVSGYADVAANGPTACQRPGVLYPCRTEDASGLEKPDGIILLDPGLGAFTTASNVDPAYIGDTRVKTALDMYAASNGYDAKTGEAHYTAEFRKRYFAAQAAMNNALVDKAIARLKIIEKGKGDFRDDEPLTVAGAINVRSATSLHRTDLSLLSHTKVPHLFLKADGTDTTEIIRSIRPSTGPAGMKAIGSCCGDINYGVKRFLGNDAVKLTPDFAMTEDDILGVDWKTSNTSSPLSAEGVRVPSLVMTNSCFQFVVPSEIVFDHLAAQDKSFVGVEGSEHFLTPCKPEYGDTRKRIFDFIDGWIGKAGRF